MIKTFVLSPSYSLPAWFIVNAENQILGRFASQITQFLLNKFSKTYNPAVVSSIHCIIINADKIIVSGEKNLTKKYKTFSGYQGGLAFKTFLHLKSFNYQKLLRSAIHGMLPKNCLGRRILSNLFFSKTKSYKYVAQKPRILFFSTN